ncbi:hypothetical protein AXJ14_gp060 [Geobacillus virus E3]|uniref:hypothetical protein n=1 Tax=Geobacillus virus E3 TaxID=1572712 RepID=UPI0006719F2D|nr:hypothetical protein AXJ14_gp060 [Geobacillus virus E3]AJA41379.1 hypothetical protein E3_060 [Geobacillus virus E3]
MIDKLINEYAEKYINDSENKIDTKIGYCKFCLQEKWGSATNKKELYEYTTLKNDKVFICKDHVGCHEIAKELMKYQKPFDNELEKKRWERELKQLIKKGEQLLF